jgi:hypothetical protein
MNGEAIYRNKLASHYRPVVQMESSRRDRWTDGMSLALRNFKTQTSSTDPASVLVEMGIPVDSDQREPRLLEVSHELLLSAKIALQDFTLIDKRGLTGILDVHALHIVITQLSARVFVLWMRYYYNNVYTNLLNRPKHVPEFPRRST